MQSNQRRIGIIGIGFGTQVHAPGFRSEGWEVAALCSRDREKTRQAADAADIADIHTDPFELIARPDITAVSITTPPGAHHPLTLAALKAGKHVLCEKPFARDATQAREMRDAAANSGCTAMVAHEFRHAPQRAFIRDLVAAGHIGRFELCTIDLSLDRFVSREPRPFTWMGLEAAGGGMLGALGSHYIDALRHWFGDIATVAGTLRTLRPDLRDSSTGAIVQSETDDMFSFTVTFRNGGLATMTATFSANPARPTRIVVMGDEGTLIAEQPGANPLEDGVVLASREGAPLQPLPTPARYLPLADPRDHRLMAFRLLVRDFTRGIEAGTSPAPNFDDGLRCQQVLDAIRQASASGRTIVLD